MALTLIVGAGLLLATILGFVLARRWSDLRSRGRTALAMVAIMLIGAVTAAIYGQLARPTWTRISIQGNSGEVEVKAGAQARCLRKGQALQTARRDGTTSRSTVGSTAKPLATRFSDMLIRSARLTDCRWPVSLGAGAVRPAQP